jgi:DNA polymerase III epsilon subunit family exonuclease
MKMNRIVFDTETTGLTLPEIADLKQQPKIIEIGAVRIDGENVVARYSQLIYPGELITSQITKITGITNEDLKGKPTFAEIVTDIKKLFDGVDELIAHNAPFDCALLRYDLQRCGINDFVWPRIITCTVQEFAHINGYNLKLTQLYEIIMNKQLAQTHRALDDVDALVEILDKVGYFKDDTFADSY